MRRRNDVVFIVRACVCFNVHASNSRMKCTVLRSMLHKTGAEAARRQQQQTTTLYSFSAFQRRGVMMTHKCRQHKKGLAEKMSSRKQCRCSFEQRASLTRHASHEQSILELSQYSELLLLPASSCCSPPSRRACRAVKRSEWSGVEWSESGCTNIWCFLRHHARLAGVFRHPRRVSSLLPTNKYVSQTSYLLGVLLGMW